MAKLSPRSGLRLEGQWSHELSPPPFNKELCLCRKVRCHSSLTPTGSREGSDCYLFVLYNKLSPSTVIQTKSESRLNK